MPSDLNGRSCHNAAPAHVVNQRILRNRAVGRPDYWSSDDPDTFPTHTTPPSPASASLLPPDTLTALRDRVARLERIVLTPV